MAEFVINNKKALADGEGLYHGTILLGPRTEEHEAFLQRKGYVVTHEGGHIKICCTGFVSEVDLRHGEEILEKIAQEGLLCTYQTKFHWPDKELSGIFACARLDDWSAMVVKPIIEKEK